MEDEILVKGKFWQFEKAREYLHSLKFKTIADFRRWWKYGISATEETPLYVNESNIACPHRPPFLPYCPEAIYGREFTDIRDYVLNKCPNYRKGFKIQISKHIWSWSKSSAFVRQYRFANAFDYEAYCKYSATQQPGDPDYINFNNIVCPKRPQGLPFTPRQTLFRDWTDWNTYLHGKMYKKYYVTTHPFKLYYKYDVAKTYLRKIKFRDIEEYFSWMDYSVAYKPGDPLFVTSSGKHIRKKPHFIPTQPKKYYADRWISLHSYLSLHNAEDAGKERRTIKVRSNHERFKRNVAFTYEEACEYIHAYKFESIREFSLYCKHTSLEPFVTKLGLKLPLLPRNFPKNPKEFYISTGDWVSWEHFLNIPEKVDNSEKIAEFFEKTKYKHYRSAAEWRREVDSVGTGLVGHINRAARLNQWEGFRVELNRDNVSNCSYLDAKILLSFRNLQNLSHYFDWYRKHNYPFFMPSLDYPQTLQRAYNDDSVTLDDFFTVDLVEKLNTQKLAVPVFVVSLTRDNDFVLDILKAGKYDAYLKFGSKSNSYVFEYTDTQLLNTILSHHCTLNDGNEYTANHLGLLYNDIRNNFKQINFANIND